jgi:hypothetical protein
MTFFDLNLCDAGARGTTLRRRKERDWMMKWAPRAHKAMLISEERPT